MMIDSQFYSEGYKRAINVTAMLECSSANKT